MKNKILLFDMDGVLLIPGGYRQALISSVKYFAQLLGITDIGLDEAEISQLEAKGFTNEWDCLAAVVGMLLLHVWRENPAARLEVSQIKSRHSFDLQRGIDALLLKEGAVTPIQFDMSYLDAANLSLDQKEYLSAILAYSKHAQRSKTMLVHQEFVLGSEIYNEYYGENQMQGFYESALLQHDQPAASQEWYLDLKSWVEKNEHAAVIFTNRPGTSLAGYASPPEAEMGRKLLDLGKLPIVSGGLLSWVGRSHGEVTDQFLKPHPLHALVALLASQGGHPVTWVNVAQESYQAGKYGDSWAFLQGAEVIVFEDNLGGILSAKSAQCILQSKGIEFELTCIGVSNNQDKRDSLMKEVDVMVEGLGQYEFKTM